MDGEDLYYADYPEHHYDQGQDQDYGYEHPQEPQEYYGDHHRRPFGASEPEEYVQQRGNDHFGDVKMFRNIIRKYGPEDKNQHVAFKSGERVRSPGENKRTEINNRHVQNYYGQNYPFHPEIRDMPRDIYKNSGGKLDISKEEQWNRLLKPKTELIQERERLKYEKEAQEIQENCSFQPNVHKSGELSNTSRYGKQQSITDRLYNEGVERQKMKEMEKYQREVDDECTFQPDVADSVKYLKGEKVTQRPLHERLGEIMKQKQDFLQRIRIEAENSNKDMCFKPTLGEHSQILAEAKQEVRDVTERLMKDAADKVFKRMKQIEEHETHLNSVCTFKPNLNPISKNSDSILAGNDLYMAEKDVVTRQFLMTEVQRENLQRRAAEIIAEKGYTFQPKINKISQFLMEADPERGNENDEERIARLYKKDAQKREIFHEQMQKAQNEKYDFKPTINQISKELGKKSTVDEMSSNKQAKEHLRILREMSIDNMMASCSFRPNINNKKKFQAVEPYYNDEVRIMDNVKLVNKRKEIKNDQQRKIAEYDEMKECTFKPKINADVSEEALKPKLAEKVAGMDKFMQIRDKHKQKILEKKKREEEVFGIEKKYSAAKHEGFTTPKPFHLSRGNKHSIRDEKVAKDLQEKMARQYTFKPVTNEGKNREIINNMIGRSRDLYTDM